MIWSLLLAHFLADYPLQPGWMVRSKHRPPVMLMHVGTHLALNCLLFLPSLRGLFPYLVSLAGIHALIDYTKLWVNRVKPAWVISPYVVDQGLHMLTLALLAIIAQPAVRVITLVPGQIATIATGYLLVTFVWFVTERVLMHTFPTYLVELHEELWPRMLARAILLSIVLGGMLRANHPSFALAWTVWLPYRSPYAWRNLVIDLAVALTVSLLVYAALAAG